MADALLPSIPGKLEENGVFVWRMPESISQSGLGGRKEPSNACTLIALHLVEILYKTNTIVPRIVNGRRNVSKDDSNVLITDTVCPPRLMGSLLEAIVLGNEHHARCLHMRKSSTALSTLNYTIPDAIAACGNRISELDFISCHEFLPVKLPRLIRTISRIPSLMEDERIFMPLISIERAVLLVYERSQKLISCFDSHFHRDQGALIASCPFYRIKDFCIWLSTNVFPEHSLIQGESRPHFELSVVRFSGVVGPDECAPPVKPLPSGVEQSIFNSCRTVSTKNTQKSLTTPIQQKKRSVSPPFSICKKRAVLVECAGMDTS